MNVPLGIYLIKSLYDIAHDAQGFRLFDPPLLANQVIEIAGIAILCDDVGIVLGLEHIKEFENVLAIEGFEGSYLVLEESGMNGLLYHLHVNHLDCNWGVGIFIPTPIDFAGEASTDFLIERIAIMINGLPGLARIVLLVISDHGFVLFLFQNIKLTILII